MIRSCGDRKMDVDFLARLTENIRSSVSISRLYRIGPRVSVPSTLSRANSAPQDVHRLPPLRKAQYQQDSELASSL
ncbi:hypothetical protein PM082_009453 [Marasmius tenuissimus]|nr:hypothetical protein PM082_009453 [Marasmius tenuissimus]